MADGLPGTPGGPVIAVGVTALEAEERGLVRLAEFVAVTLNVYALPFVKPVTVLVVAVSASTVG
jgi:hypothetical protein